MGKRSVGRGSEGTAKRAQDVGESDAFARYAQSARRFPPLKREAEHVLALRVREGDAAAREELFNHNVAYVLKIACSQRRGTLPLDDIIQEGCLGLLRAIEKFDPHAGTRFLTYATWWIRAFIGRHLQGARSAVRRRNGVVAQQDFSLDNAIGDEDEGDSYLDRLVDEGVGPEGACHDADRDRRVQEALMKAKGRLGGLGWEIVHARLERDDPMTLAELGQRWSVSRERVRQVEVKTKDRLRRCLDGVEDGDEVQVAA